MKKLKNGDVILIAFIIVAALIGAGALGYALGKKAAMSEPAIRDIPSEKQGQSNQRECTDEAKICPDGSAVGRTGPNCEFAACLLPDAGEKGVMCTMEAKLCPDGSYVGRTGPNCEFSSCPGS